jgi:hypothetical protein
LTRPPRSYYHDISLREARATNEKVLALTERRAAMVSNLMFVLCGERDTQPVVNTGTLYH